MIEQYYLWLQSKWFVISIIIANILGTIYGYYWYMPQLENTKWFFIPFVPDSPTATLFLVIALILTLFKKHNGYFEALAFVTLIKYGIWAVIMNIFTFVVLHEVTFIGMMLICSHSIMAIQAFFFYPLFKIKVRHIVITAIWVFHNDVIDYVYMQYPIYSMLSEYIQHIGYFSFWLSISCLLCLLYLNNRDKIFD
ncbi:DUF1405 domain-containing protein [Macrococcus sp. DPC7161]|uniref:DUF1405 domain-containing protein n=1 Tax=Macrococcus sp. DPC7161 TaxID=2507060 RepID=UPI00100B16C8|nr:DUF1405 domain-containing protein [Macrococcus sp. DPC7161]RXK19269.1 DUF1405 domain-containing protein [Macrococcus sp. DPC7161]